MWPALVVEIAGMLPPVKECQQPPDAGRGKGRVPVEPPGGRSPTDTWISHFGRQSC